MKKFSKITVLLVVMMVISFVTVAVAADAPAAKKEGAKAAKKEEPKKKPKPKPLAVGDMVTDFTLPVGLSPDKSISFLKDIKGKAKATALVFMTTSCSACKAELTFMGDLTGKFGDDFKVYAISVDLNGAKTIPDYDSVYAFNVTYLLDPDFSVPHKFGFTYTPSMAIVDITGKVIYVAGGFSTAANDGIIKAIKSAL
jgi:peroxiredoxin